MKRSRQSTRTVSSGNAEVHSIRLAPDVFAKTERAAEKAGLPWATWSAKQLAMAAVSTADRFETLEDVLKMQLGRGDIARLAAELGPVLLDDPALLRGAIAAAWATGRGPAIRSACEKIIAQPCVQLSKGQHAVLVTIHRNRPYDAGQHPQRAMLVLARRGLIVHTPLGWHTTSLGEAVADGRALGSLTIPLEQSP